MAFLRQKQFGVVSQVADKPVGGVLLTPAQVFDSRLLVVNQMTPNQTLSLPSMSTIAGATSAFDLRVRNAGSVPFAMHGASVRPNTIQDYTWHGVAWCPAGASINAESVLLLAPLTGRAGNNVGAVLVEINNDVLQHDSDLTTLENRDFVADLNL